MDGSRSLGYLVDTLISDVCLIDRMRALKKKAKNVNFVSCVNIVMYAQCLLL